MYAQKDKPRENKSRAVANSVAQKKSCVQQGFGFLDNRQETIVQRKIQAMADNRQRSFQMKKWQEEVSNGPKAQQLKSFQGMANHISNNEQPIQKRVAIKGIEIDSIVDYLIATDWDVLLSVEECEAAGWMLGLTPTWDFKGPEDLLLYINKVYSLTKLIRSVFATGILSRSKLAERAINYTGSEDKGNVGALAVNILDWRTREGSPEKIADESMTAEDRGSISVAFEREKDWLKQEELVKPEDIEFTEQEMEEYSKKYGESLSLMLPYLKRARASEINEGLMTGLLNPEMKDRAMNTIMAVVNQPGVSIANLSERSASYESDVPSGEIPAGNGGFTSLLIPEWFRPFYLMIEDLQPKGVKVMFVGTKTITANYKTKAGHIPVTVDAPDYASEVSRLLKEFGHLASHILKA